MSDWISVDKKLPEVGQWCIVVVDNRLDYLHRMFSWNKNKPDTDVVCASLRYIDAEGFAGWEQGRLASGHSLRQIDNVTHWMPLPEPPPKRIEFDSGEYIDLLPE